MHNLDHTFAILFLWNNLLKLHWNSHFLLVSIVLTCQSPSVPQGHWRFIWLIRVARFPIFRGGYIGSKGISTDRFDEYLYSPSNCRLGVSPKCVSLGRNTRGVLKNTVTHLWLCLPLLFGMAIFSPFAAASYSSRAILLYTERDVKFLENMQLTYLFIYLFLQLKDENFKDLRCNLDSK